MQRPSNEDLQKLMVGAAINIVLCVDEKVRTVLEACEKYDFPIEYWSDVVTDEDGEIRGACLNQKPIPPFNIYHEGDFLDGEYWDMDSAVTQAEWYQGMNPGDYSLIEIQNFAGNTCGSVGDEGYEDLNEGEEESQGFENIPTEFNPFRDDSSDVKFHFNDGDDDAEG